MSRRVAPLFAFFLVMIFAGIAGAVVIGFARTGDDPAVTRTANRFSAAIRQHDGAAACAQLAAAAVKALEQQEQEKCEKAVLKVGLKGGRVSRSDVAERSAKADVGEDGSVFLEQTRKGWLITAFGCKPVKARPYDCEVEA